MKRARVVDETERPLKLRRTMESVCHPSREFLVLGGKGDDGQLGRAESALWEPVVLAWEGKSPIVAVRAGERHTAVVTADGTLFTAGTNENGQLGRDGRTSRFLAVESLETKAVIGVACSREATVAVLSDGTGAAWGSNEEGLLGVGGREPTARPRLIRHQIERTTATAVVQQGPTVGIGLAAVETGDTHAIALTRDGQVLTWGDSSRFQRGDGSRMTSTLPAPVPGLRSRPVVSVAAGAYHCIILTTGA